MPTSQGANIAFLGLGYQPVTLVKTDLICVNGSERLNRKGEQAKPRMSKS